MITELGHNHELCIPIKISFAYARIFIRNCLPILLFLICFLFLNNHCRTAGGSPYTVNTRIKENGFLHLGSEFLNKIHHFNQGKRYRLPRKGHFCIFEVSGFILAKILWLKGDIHRSFSNAVSFMRVHVYCARWVKKYPCSVEPMERRAKDEFSKMKHARLPMTPLRLWYTMWNFSWLFAWSLKDQKRVKSVLKHFEKWGGKRVLNVLKTGVGLGKTNVDLRIKYGLSKLLSWLLDILNIVWFISFIEESVLLLVKYATTYYKL